MNDEQVLAQRIALDRMHGAGAEALGLLRGLLAIDGIPSHHRPYARELLQAYDDARAAFNTSKAADVAMVELRT